MRGSCITDAVIHVVLRLRSKEIVFPTPKHKCLLKATEFLDIFQRKRKGALAEHFIRDTLISCWLTEISQSHGRVLISQI